MHLLNGKEKDSNFSILILCFCESWCATTACLAVVVFVLLVRQRGVGGQPVFVWPERRCRSGRS